MASPSRTSNRSTPPALLVALIAATAVFALTRGRSGPSPVAHCDTDGSGCPEAMVPEPETEVRSAQRAEAFCVNVGYLCAGLAEGESIRLQRWREFSGTMVVHVPLPPSVDPALGRQLQRAAAQGIRAWNNQPFPVLADLRGDRNPRFAIRWKPTLGGLQLGIAHTEWSSTNGLRVLEIELAAQPPGASAAGLTRQIQLTAAHEMGHALGLTHSDSPRDVMYSTNTATTVSARDRRSMEALYATPDGTIISP